MLVEPLYRLMFGRPLADQVPWGIDRSRDETAGRSCCQGLVLVVDGVGGFDLCGTALRYVLGAPGLAFAIHVFPWGHGFGRWIADLTDVTNRDDKAVLLAALVRRFRTDRPGYPVFLVAKSGGSGVVIKALEQLDESSVQRAILLSPALSPEYDLTGAMGALSGELVVFWSPFDIIFLGVGTRLFGTVDRVRSPSAGLLGFRIPSAADKDPAGTQRASQYTKLRQIRWSPRMAATGYLGGHFGPDSPVFLKNYVVPLLRTRPDA
jgi:hypothetical protein